MLSVSVPVQVNIWWVTHMVVLYLTIRFPFKVKTWTAARRLHVFHLVSLFVGLLYSLLPIIATIVNDALQRKDSITYGRLGFGFITFPPILCTGRYSNIVFYLTILPSVFLMVIGTTSLVMMIWTVHQVGIMLNIS